MAFRWVFLPDYFVRGLAGAPGVGFNFGGIEDGDSGEGEGQESGKRGGGESKDGISREGGNPAIEADECSPLVKAEFVHPIE
eukprot:292784-Amorphochlora_amoeboformis.AAC.1